MIHVDNLSKYYDHFCAVDEISLDIRKGEILGLLGPNGAGKTTTLKMLTGYFSPSSGSIRVGSYNIAEHPLEIKQMIGYLPESSPFYTELLVYDYLNYVAKIRGIAPEDVEALFGPAFRIERQEGGEDPTGPSSAWYWLRRTARESDSESNE